MANFHFELVSPQKLLFSGDVQQVDVPGAEGEFGVLADHAPMVTTLRPGIVTIFRGSAREPVVVTGGFAEVGPGGLTILADRAVARADFDMATLAAEIKDAEEDVADATDQAVRDKLVRHLDQLKALKAALGTATPAAGH
jgi:F-type H+-transporting ATPase subunit epsilon